MKIRTLCTLLLLLPGFSPAMGVNTKNGDFYITYRDISQSAADHELNVERVYNSKSTENGWFGFGWGSDFETQLTVMPDNSVVVHEDGAGATTYYSPRDGSGLQAGVERIVAAAIGHDQLDHDAAEALRTKLLHDENLRRSKVSEYGIQTRLPVGGIAQADECNVVTRINDEYRRTHCSGTVIDYFDLSGHLLRKEDGNYRVDVHYAGKYPDMIEDSAGQKLFFTWTAAGHVADVRSGGAEPTVLYYRYDEGNNLLLANTMGGVDYHYEYDGNHNMTRIVYLDNTHMDMQYNSDSLITAITRPDGEKTTYSYRTDPKSPQTHYWTTTTRISPTGEQSSREEEYSLDTDTAGVEHLAGLNSTDGDRKQNVVMDGQGRIKYVKKPDGGFMEYFYHPTFNKISAVVSNEMSTIFTYNKAGDMIRAYNSDDQLIRLDYDSKRRIIRMSEANKTQHTRFDLAFNYNEFGKPTKIRMIGKGAIDVEYDDQGEIAKVSSKQGAKIALQVTAAFQTLLKVVNVAGVDLGM